MCGIVGMWRKNEVPMEPGILSAMCAAIRHRGPDDEGHYINGPVGLAMRRLSIIDLEGGRQPIHNEDQTIWVVFNGEIYNYRELREGLESAGHVFYTRSDTEVIVHLYERYGGDFMTHLRGMFAIALWDGARRRLILVRDRLGIKPLYYVETAEGLAFASELKGLLCLPWVTRQFDPEGVLHYFKFGYVGESHAIFRGVRKLEPAHVAEYDGGRVTVRRYWDLPPPDAPPLDLKTIREELLPRLEEAVRLRLVSDVPIGAFLSGGVDSSTIVALMAGLKADLRTFTIGFRESQYDESRYARAFAQKLGAEHHELIVEPSDLSLVETLVWHQDEPFGDQSMIPTYVVSRLASRHLKVVLSGDGGDELFGGYTRYQVDLRRSIVDLVPVAVRQTAYDLAEKFLPGTFRGKNLLRNLSLARADRYIHSISYFPEAWEPGLWHPEFYRGVLEGTPTPAYLEALSRGETGSFSERLMRLDLRTYLPGDILAKVDRMSMANSLEARVPFLDHPFVEFVQRIPSSLKLGRDGGKRIFKELVARLLPREILERPKRGFGIPLDIWFRGTLWDDVREILLDRRTRERKILNTHAVEGLIEAARSGRSERVQQVWMLLVFEIWCRLFMDRPEPGRIPVRP